MTKGKLQEKSVNSLYETVKMWYYRSHYRKEKETEMNKNEIAEIRRRFTFENNNITRMRGCYINDKKEIIAQFDSTLTLMGQDEVEKYLGIFKKTLSGSLGKNLIDIAFSTSQVTESEEHGLLTRLRETGLKDDETVTAFFTKIADKFNIDGNYLILLMHDTYDIPVHSKDGSRLEDSTKQFSYILCSICPVKLTKPGLRYDETAKQFKPRITDWIVSSPDLGFMFPAYDGRAANIYGALYYTRDAKTAHYDFTDTIFNAQMPLPAPEQKELFGSVLSEALKEECSYEVVQSVNTHLSEMIEAHEADKELRKEPLLVTRTDIRAVLEACEVPEEQIGSFEEEYNEKFGAASALSPANIIDAKKVEVKTPSVSVKVARDHSELVETRVIDGVQYVMIRVDGGVEVNGVNISIKE